MYVSIQQSQAAADFAKRWAGRGYEKGDSQSFWLDLLGSVCGVANAATFIRFEEQVKVDTTNFIDGHIPSTRVLIEQKSLGKDLRKGIVQSDGSTLTPFEQARRYILGLPVSQYPRWIVTCNFEEFLIYDMERPHAEPESLLLKDLDKDYYRLHFLVDTRSEVLQRELEVSVKAGEIIGKIYDALLAEPPAAMSRTDYLHALNAFCVRLVFCFYAEDAGIFQRNQFHDYLARFNSQDFRRALMSLFSVLATPPAARDPFLEDDLAAFPYVNGGLFTASTLIPPITLRAKTFILERASAQFDWSEISPTIFGAVFESTLNPETRRAGGMHYTSVENIHKVIDPLFLDALKADYRAILAERVEKKRQRALDAFQQRLASFTFLDPACGSGNFLTETYLSLRRLENEVIRERYQGQQFLPGMNPVRVSIQQFHGIEINDFAVTVATTALWISEAQMLAETERITGQDLDFLPLKTYTNIIEDNALHLDWPKTDYIIGNPPFVGARMMNAAQKDDVNAIFGKKWKNVGNLDYVCCWYKKAWEVMKETPQTRAALVSTNSITQGEQVANLWQPLMAEGLRIIFAHRTFRWDSEASLKAHVHCVIIGFGAEGATPEIMSLPIFEGERVTYANHINAYLLDAPDVFIESRKTPLCDVPQMLFDSMPNDGGHLCGFTDEDKALLVSQHPQAEALLRPFVGAQEFIHGISRWCLWLKGVSPALIKSVRPVYEAVEGVRSVRAASTRQSTREKAATPTLFGEDRQPTAGHYLLVPRVSSERRRYVPIGFMDANTVASDAVQIIPDATLYHFGVLESNVHMAWMRSVCGRLKSDYRYSKDIVYNNFPWPEPTDVQRAKIEQTAQAILDARALYPDSSLADLYDELTMPAELRRAHQRNDRAVMEAYGLPTDTGEEDIVKELFLLYDQITQ